MPKYTLTGTLAQRARSLAALLLCAGAIPALHAASLTGLVTLVDREDRPLPEQGTVVLFVEGADDASRDALRAASAPFTTPKVSHRNMQFSPHVLPIRAGTVVDFLNDDGIFHNAFSLSKAKPFDLGIYPQGTSKPLTFDTSGLVRVYCNLHPQMVGNILVLDNSFHTLSGADGSWRIDGLPAGAFTLRSWSENADPRQIGVELNADVQQHIELKLPLRRQFVQHRNKFGKPYRGKY